MVEQWEIDLRNKLEKEIPDGKIFHMPGILYSTGKKGYIDFEVALQKHVRKNYGS